MRLGVLLFFVAACGDVTNNHHIVDSPSGDGTVDSPGSTTTVTMTMKDSNGPIVNSKVYFQANDSSVIATIATDANGVASTPMPNGGYVTIIDPDATTTGSIRTWAGVKNGDSLVYDTSRAAATTSTVTFTIPRVATAATYTIQTPCGSTTNAPAVGNVGAFPVSVTLTCGPTVDVLVEVIDANNRLLSSFFVPDQNITAPVDYSLQTYTNAANRSFTLDNNTGSKAWSLSDRFAVAQGNLFTATGIMPASVQTTLSVLEPALPANVLDVTAYTTIASTTSFQIETWGSTGGTVALDIGSFILPSFAGPPAFDVASHTFEWTQTANTATPDFAEAIVEYTRGTGAAAKTYIWGLVSPNTTTVPFPVLPDDAAALNVLGTDVIQASIVELVKYPGGYDVARPIIFKSSTLPPGPTGTLLISTYHATTPG